MNKSLILGSIVAVGAIAITGITSVQAYQGDSTKTGPNHSPEREAQMVEIMEKRDFTAWKKIMSEDERRAGILSVIDTQAEFDKFAESFELAHEGKHEEAKAIRDELGLAKGPRDGHGEGIGQRQGQGNGSRSGNGERKGNGDGTGTCVNN